MRCPYCSAEIQDGCSFCTNCGKYLEDTRPKKDSDDTLQAPAEKNAVKQSEESKETAARKLDNASKVGNDKKVKSRSRLLFGVVGLSVLAAAAVVVVLIHGGALPNPFTAQKQQVSPAAPKQQVSLKIIAPNYHSDTDSKIPLRISGKTIGGKDFNKLYYIDTEQPDIELEQGNYKIRLEASPLLMSGDIYELSEPVEFNLSEKTSDSADCQIECSVKPPEEVTKDDITRAKQVASNGGFDSAKVEKAVKTIVVKQTALLYRDLLSEVSSYDFGEGIPENSAEYTYALQDVNADGIPDMVVSAENYNELGGPNSAVRVWTTTADGSGIQEISGTIEVQRLTHALWGNVLLYGVEDGNGLYAVHHHASSEARPDTNTLYSFQNGTMSGTEQTLSQDKIAELEFVSINDLSPIDKLVESALEASATDEVPTSNDVHDKAIADAKSKGLTALTGTIKTMTNDEIVNYCAQNGFYTEDEAASIRKSLFTTNSSNFKEKKCTIFVLDTPQELAWVEPDDPEPITGNRKTFLIAMSSDSWSTYDNKHLIVGFDNTKTYWSTGINPCGKQPIECDSATLITEL